MERRRAIVVGLVACMVHVIVLGAVRARPTAADEAERARAAAKAEQARLLAHAEDDVRHGRASLGDVLLRLDAIEAPEAEAKIRGEYRELLAGVRAELGKGASIQEAIVRATEARPLRYKRMYPRLYDALAHGGGNCVAQSTLAAALAYDAGFPERAGVLVFQNHVAPDVDGFHFGMVARCRGAGIRVAAISLVAAYARAREKGDTDPFDLPHADAPCDDPGDVFGEAQLEANDPPLGSKKAAPVPSDGAECRRRTPMDEYQDDVEILGADGRSLGGASVPRLSSLDLAGHAASVGCFERRLEAIAPTDTEALVLALGDAAMAAEAAARVFAQAGEIDVTREYEKRLAGYRERAAVPTEALIRSIEGGADAGATIAGAGRLVALGEGGRTLMLLATGRHRGYWELANLMTQPASQVGALRRWVASPPELQRDVVALLPCASAVFRGQLAGSEDGRTVLTRCDERLQREAIARATSTAPGTRGTSR